LTVRGGVVLCLAVCWPAAASANPLPAKTLRLPIRVPSLGNLSAGAAVLRVTYTDRDATATVTAPRVRLSRRPTFRLVSCLRAYSATRSHASLCRPEDAAHARVAAAPTVTLPLGRPPPDGRAWFTYEVSVQRRQADDLYTEVASSWPRTDVAGASVGVPGLGASTAATPTTIGAPLSTGGPGGVNTGQPDSFCAASEVPSSSPLEPGVRTTGLGSHAPAYYEIGEPTGRFAGQAPKGVMLVIHGGSWFVVGPGVVAGMRQDADRWRARGWRTLNIGYHACGASIPDVQWFYDAARARWGTALPYCALGTSAGGHLALELSLTRTGLFCVIDRAGPPDGLALPRERTVTTGRDGARRAYNWMVAAFGPDDLGWWFPPLSARPFAPTRILYASAVDDVFIPWRQGLALRAKVRAADPEAYVDLDRLAPGPEPFVHARVARSSLEDYYARERELVAPLG
jgi:hypothetical protein